jgi:hypothetical protein
MIRVSHRRRCTFNKWDSCDTAAGSKCRNKRKKRCSKPCSHRLLLTRPGAPPQTRIVLIRCRVPRKRVRKERISKCSLRSRIGCGNCLHLRVRLMVVGISCRYWMRSRYARRRRRRSMMTVMGLCAGAMMETLSSAEMPRLGSA